MTVHLAMWSTGGAVVDFSPLLSIQQIVYLMILILTFSDQIEYYELECIVLTSDFAGKLLKIMKDDPTSIPTLSSLVLSDPFVDEETQKTAELFHISLFLSSDLLNPSITLAPYSQMTSFVTHTHNSAEQIDISSNPTPPSNIHHRKLRLVRNEQRFVHKASVDDYDCSSPENDSPQPVVYPLLTYDPGLLDTALIFVVLQRGKCSVEKKKKKVIRRE